MAERSLSLSHAFALPAWPLNVREMRQRPVSLSTGRGEFLQLDCGVRKCVLKKNALRSTLLPVAQTREKGDGEKGDVPETRAHTWYNTWYPLQFEELADKAAPSSCTILAAPVVFWWDSVALQWAAVLDICPHRLVPLSEGRVCGKTGHIECPYHGWTFRGTDGSCAKIPQLEAGKEINQARARATHVPVLVRDGIIWCWGGALVSGSSYADPLPPDESILERLLVESIRAPGVMKLDYFRDLPMDATILTENVLDPSHLPFTHHKTISRRTRAAPIDLKLHGKVERHGFKAFKGNVTGGGVAFTAPHHVLSVTHRKNSFSDWNVVYAVPQRPGTQFACFTSTKVQILTPDELRGRSLPRVCAGGVSSQRNAPPHVLAFCSCVPYASMGIAFIESQDPRRRQHLPSPSRQNTSFTPPTQHTRCRHPQEQTRAAAARGALVRRGGGGCVSESMADALLSTLSRRFACGCLSPLA